jgi:hypothetical protein
MNGQEDTREKNLTLMSIAPTNNVPVNIRVANCIRYIVGLAGSTQIHPRVDIYDKLLAQVLLLFHSMETMELQTSKHKFIFANQLPFSHNGT